jgi:glycine C-acetyltransferase
MDLFDKIKAQQGPLSQYADYGHDYFFFPKLEGEIGPRMKFKGKEKIIWSVNSYLGLANHPEVREADAAAAAKYGMAYPMGSRMMSGNTEEHEALERELSAFVGKEDTFLLNFGYQGVVSIIDAVVDRRDVIVYDADCHACILDGVRLHMGKRFRFNHNDVADCAKQLDRARKITEQTGGAILVISEGVFGMRGEQGKLREIISLKETYDFRIFVDDAHGFGVLGATGAGAGEEQGIQEDIDLYFSTFAKSMAGIGAFVSGEREIIRHLRYTMRSQVFAKSLPMPMVIGARKRLELIKTTPELRERLWSNVRRLQSGLKERGFDIGDTNSCVTPVYMHGSVAEACGLTIELREKHDIFCSMVVYPVIPKGMILLRLIPTAAHTFEDVDLTLEAFSTIKARLQEGAYSEMPAWA